MARPSNAAYWLDGSSVGVGGDVGGAGVGGCVGGGEGVILHVAWHCVAVEVPCSSSTQLPVTYWQRNMGMGVGGVGGGGVGSIGVGGGAGGHTLLPSGVWHCQ